MRHSRHFVHNPRGEFEKRFSNVGTPAISTPVSYRYRRGEQIADFRVPEKSFQGYSRMRPTAAAACADEDQLCCCMGDRHERCPMLDNREKNTRFSNSQTSTATTFGSRFARSTGSARVAIRLSLTRFVRVSISALAGLLGVRRGIGDSGLAFVHPEDRPFGCRFASPG